MKCSVCGEDGFVNYDQLVNHILATNDDKHESARVYAKRKLESLKWGKNIRRDPVCPVCHKPYEGGKADKVCQC